METYLEALLDVADGVDRMGGIQLKKFITCNKNILSDYHDSGSGIVES
jgi:hypothetical protein